MTAPSLQFGENETTAHLSDVACCCFSLLSESVRASHRWHLPPSRSQKKKEHNLLAFCFPLPPAVAESLSLVEKEDNICAYTGGERGSLLPVVVVCCRRRCPGSSSSSFPFWALFPLAPSDTDAKKAGTPEDDGARVKALSKEGQKGVRDNPTLLYTTLVFVVVVGHSCTVLLPF